MHKNTVRSEKNEKGRKPLHEGVEKKHLVKPIKTGPKEGNAPPPIKKSK
jgi:hypothetical protein